MSDLRTRIAAALLERFFAREDVALDAADAVIRELGMRQETTYDRSWKTGTRYVTAWKADDE